MAGSTVGIDEISDVDYHVADVIPHVIFCIVDIEIYLVALSSNEIQDGML